MDTGVVVERHLATPQGGPLSPLLANVLLDGVDSALEVRGYSFALRRRNQTLEPPGADPARRVVWQGRLLRMEAPCAGSRSPCLRLACEGLRGPYFTSIWRAVLTGCCLASVSVSTPFSSFAPLACASMSCGSS